MDDIPYLELPPDLAPVAHNEINEPYTLEEKKAVINEFLEKIESALSEGDARPTARDALKYLRLRKWRLDSALETYSNRIAFFKEHAEQLHDIQLQDFQEMHADSFVRVVTGRDLQQRRIVCMRARNPKKYHPIDVAFLRWLVFVMDALSEDVYFQVHGMILLNNLGESRMQDALYMAGMLRSGRMGKAFHWMQDCAPARVSTIINLRPPAFVHIVWNLLQLFLKPKLRQRVRFVRDMRSMDNMIDPAVLPPLWGGTSDEDPWAWFNEQLAKQQAGGQ